MKSYRKWHCFFDHLMFVVFSAPGLVAWSDGTQRDWHVFRSPEDDQESQEREKREEERKRKRREEEERKGQGQDGQGQKEITPWFTKSHKQHEKRVVARKRATAINRKQG